MCMICEREFANTTLQYFTSEDTKCTILFDNILFGRPPSFVSLQKRATANRYIGYAGPLPTNGKAFATPKVVAALLPMALEGDTLEILLQNNAESIALDPQALKTCPDIRNGFLEAENASFPESRMLSTSMATKYCHTDI